MTFLDPFPLCRCTAGFDRPASLLGGPSPNRRQSGHPPCGVESIGEHGRRIDMAVTAFGQEDVEAALEKKNRGFQAASSAGTRNGAASIHIRASPP